MAADREFTERPLTDDERQLMTERDVPVFQESMAGALIDSARISVMAALSMLPPREAPLIILPGEEEQMAEDAAGTAEGCLEQAMQWLDAARVHTVATGAPVTSLHVAGPAR